MPESPQVFRGRPQSQSSAGKRQRGRALQRRRRQVFDRDGWRCRRCGHYGTVHTLQADHIVPLAQGGRDTNGNMQTLCAACHALKTGEEQHLRQRGEGSNSEEDTPRKPPAHSA